MTKQPETTDAPDAIAAIKEGTRELYDAMCVHASIHSPNVERPEAPTDPVKAIGRVTAYLRATT